MSVWPPPPDLDSLKELFAAADVEGLIADECPLDEYDPEAKHFYEETQGLPTSAFTVEKILPLLERLWAKQFMLDETQLAHRRSALLALAEQIARFFGPEAQLQTRQKRHA
jgi:hypothetical protein